MLHPGSCFIIYPNVVHLHQRENTREKRYLIKEVQTRHRPAYCRHIISEYHCPHRRCGRCRCRSGNFGVISAILTILILVLSEIIPKTIGACYWRTLALPSARIINFLIIICYPLVWLSELITRLFSSGKQELSVSREEVSAMISIGVEEGVFQMKENKMIQNLIKLDKVKSQSIMTPRTVVATAPESMSLKEFYQDGKYKFYSRIPIYNDSEDYITGYVLRQTVLEKLAEDRFDMCLKDVARPILSFPKNSPVSTVWEQMLEKKEHISILIDEYGCFWGIVTMEDIIETALGFEIVDEKDSVTDMQKLARDKWQKKLAEAKIND